MERPLLHGIHKETQISAAGRPLEITLFIWRQCNLLCHYCGTMEFYRDVAPEKNAGYIHTALAELSSTPVRTIILQGPGEPFLKKKKLYPILRKARSFGLATVIYTNGLLVDGGDIEELFELDVSLVFKLDSLDKERMISIYATRSPCEFREMPPWGHVPYALWLALSRGFAKSRRLGVSCVMDDHNLDNSFNGILNVLCFARENGVIPLFNTLLVPDRGAMTLRAKMDPSIQKKALEALAKTDWERYGYKWAPTPPVGGYDLGITQEDYVVSENRVYGWRYSPAGIDVIPKGEFGDFIEWLKA